MSWLLAIPSLVSRGLVSMHRLCQMRVGEWGSYYIGDWYHLIFRRGEEMVNMVGIELCLLTHNIYWYWKSGWMLCLKQPWYDITFEILFYE